MAFQGDSIFWVEVEKIVPNPYQPRREFDETKLRELAESIRMYGILQPLTVSRQERTREDGTFYTEYELIAGERRLRASRLAGLAQVPVIIRDGEDSEQEKLELAIIENLQREDLNAVDRALAFKQLCDQFNLSHTQVAKKVGRSREYVSNSIRILNLPDYILLSLKQGDISEGHARTLLMLSDRPEELDTVYREILLKKLSVREVERIARKIATDKVRKKDWKDGDPQLIEMEKRFTETLGTRVQIAKTDYGGRLTIDYFSEDELEAMLSKLREDTKKTDFATHTDAEAGSAAVSMAALAAHTPLTPVTSEEPESPPPTPPAIMQPQEVERPPQPDVEPVLEAPETVSPESEPLPPVSDQYAWQAPRHVVSPSEVHVAKPEQPTEPPTTPVAMIATPEPLPSVATHEPTIAAVSQSQPSIVPPVAATPEPTPPAQTAAADDESDLYAIRNFSV